MSSPAPSPLKTALVFGANGTIGSAVARSFSAAGWRVFGVVRRASSAPALAASEVIPLVGTPTDPSSFLGALQSQTRSLSVIVNTTEDLKNYASHFAAVMATLHALADAFPAYEPSSAAHQQPTKPLVLWTSGCKDYGMTVLHGAADLQPHTEASPLAPPPALEARTRHSLTLFDNSHASAFDAAVLRPTTVYGRSGSFYADAFERASEAAASGDKILTIPASPDAIAHGTHVDDVGDAYVALAMTWLADRQQVAGQCFNVSGHRYETAREIADALKAEYGLREVVYRPVPGTEMANWGNVLWAFSQWVGSEKIRDITGWRDNRALFSENVRAYRLAYEEAKSGGHEGVERMVKLLGLLKGGRSRESVDKSEGK